MNRVPDLEPCPPCTATTLQGMQCKQPSSCRLGCRRFCWVHAYMHKIGRDCTDVVEAVSNITADGTAVPDARTLSKLRNVRVNLEARNAAMDALIQQLTKELGE